MPKRVPEIVAKIERRGNRLGVGIPQKIVDQLKLKADEPVIISVQRDALIIRRPRSRRKWSEIELLNGVTPSMCGPDLVPDQVGNELI